MIKRSRTTRSLGVAILVALSVALAAPASAESEVVKDGADTPASPTDIRKVRVEHASKRVFAKVGFTDLRRRGSGGIGIWFDTDRDHKGPEYLLGSGLNNGTDYQLRHTDKWRATGDPMTCNHHLDLRFKRDRLVFWAARKCFDRPDEVRVAIKMTDYDEPSDPVVDWMTGPKEFTSWLERD